MKDHLVRLLEQIDVFYEAALANALESNSHGATYLTNEQTRAEQYYCFLFFKDLKNITCTSEELDLASKLAKFLQDQWQNTKNTLLSYTSIPSSNTTKIACSIANYLSVKSNNQTLPLEFLMPTIVNFVNVVSRENIKDVPLTLLTHLYITSDDSESLIPLELLSHLNLNTATKDILINPFSLINLTASEIDRLENHSVQTADIFYHKNNFTKRAADGMNLYTAISDLIAGLRKGSYRSNGTLNEASVEAYLALEEFRLFWSYLTSVQIERALSCNNLKYIVSNKILNPEWRDSCVYGFSDALANLLRENADLLLEIAVDENVAPKLIRVFRRKFADASAKFSDILNYDSDKISNYSGRDKWSRIPMDNTEIEIFDHNKLSDFKDQIFALLNDFSEERVLVFFSSIVDKPVEYSLFNSELIGFFIANLTVNQFNIFFNVSLRLDSSILSFHYEAFARRLNVLDDIFLKNFLASIDIILYVDLIKLTNILQIFTESKQYLFLKKYSSDLNNIHNVFSVIPLSGLASYLDLIKETLIDLVSTDIELYAFLMDLDISQRLNVLMFLKEIILACPNKYSLYKLASVFDKNQKIDFIAQFYRGSSIRSLCMEFDSIEKEVLFEKIGHDLVNFTQSIADFVFCLKWLPVDKQQDYIDLMHAKLHSFTIDKYALMSILINLPKPNRAAYLGIFNPKLLARLAISSAPFVLSTIYAYLPQHQDAAFKEELFFLENNFKSYHKKNKNYNVNALIKGNEDCKNHISAEFQIKSTLIAEMIFRTYNYRTGVKDTILNLILSSKDLKAKLTMHLGVSDLNLSNKKIKALVSRHNKFDQFLVSMSLSCWSHPKLKHLIFQHNYSLKLINALKDPIPAKCFNDIKLLLSDRGVRYQLEKSHSFWGWLMEIIGLTAGQKTIRFFDKSVASFGHAVNKKSSDRQIAILQPAQTLS